MHLVHPLQTFSHHQHYAQDRKVQRTSRAEYKRLMCTAGDRVTQGLFLGICFFSLIKELHNKQLPLYATSSDFCFWEMWPPSSRLQGALALHTATSFTFISFPWCSFQTPAYITSPVFIFHYLAYIIIWKHRVTLYKYY